METNVLGKNMFHTWSEHGYNQITTREYGMSTRISAHASVVDELDNKLYPHTVPDSMNNKYDTMILAHVPKCTP